MVFSWLNFSILVGLLVGFVFAAGSLAGGWLLSPRASGQNMGMPYECGLRPHGKAWVRFGINYYFYALLFLAFDVDVLYLFPVASYYPDSEGVTALIKVFIFLFALALGCLYFWKKGVFEWPHKIQFDKQ